MVNPTAFQTFLRLDNISGGAKDSDHKNWLEIISFEHSVTQENTGSASATGQRIVGKSVHGTFQVRKWVDKSSPFLNRACCSGKHIPTATIEVTVTSNDKKLVALQYTFEQVVIKSVKISGGRSLYVPTNGNNPTIEPLPVEDVQLEYGKIRWQHNEILNGSPAGSTQAEHDVALNTTA